MEQATGEGAKNQNIQAGVTKTQKKEVRHNRSEKQEVFKIKFITNTTRIEYRMKECCKKTLNKLEHLERLQTSKKKQAVMKWVEKSMNLNGLQAQ